MNDIKIFKCGLCKEEKRVAMARKGLRQHLKEEHRILKEIFNSKGISGKKKDFHKQRWVIEQ